MSSIIPRKYNNLVIIGLGVTALVAIGIVIWMMNKSEEPEKEVLVKSKGPTVDNRPTDTYLGSGKPSLAFFHSHTCGHCIHMKPAWESVVNTLKSTDQIEALAFEVKENPTEISMAGKIQGFPDIRFYPQGFPNGPFVEYHGDRSDEDLLRFAYEEASK